MKNEPVVKERYIVVRVREPEQDRYGRPHAPRMGMVRQAIMDVGAAFDIDAAQVVVTLDEPISRDPETFNFLQGFVSATLAVWKRQAALSEATRARRPRRGPERTPEQKARQKARGRLDRAILIVESYRDDFGSEDIDTRFRYWAKQREKFPHLFGEAPENSEG